ncbi:hypothetical protein DV735_g4457, partial [Chaetothyriales sp. CBS 134920]
MGEAVACEDVKDVVAAVNTADDSERAGNTASVSRLVSLPADILMFMIWRCVDFNTLLALRSTCRAMRKIMALELLARIRADILQSLLAAERGPFADSQFAHQWSLISLPPSWQGLFGLPTSWHPGLPRYLTCFGCLELKPLQAFVDRMSSRGTALGAKHAELRRCKDCMCRYLTIGGVWWLEQGMPATDVVRRRGRVDRWKRWLTHGDRLTKVPKDDERGVCTVCGVFDKLYWGCAGCFEKEERHQRNRSWEEKGLSFAVYDNIGNNVDNHDDNKSSRSSSNTNDVDDEANEEAELKRTHRAVKWLIEMTEEWSSSNARKRRVKYIRRRRNRGKPKWEGSWEGRMAVLVDHLRGNDIDDSSVDGDDEYEPIPDEQLRYSPAQPGCWKAIDQVPLRSNRREQRCSDCWEPCVFRDPFFLMSMAFTQPLPFDRWCQDCQDEQRVKIAKRQRPVAHGDGDQGVESVRQLFA